MPPRRRRSYLQVDRTRHQGASHETPEAPVPSPPRASSPSPSSGCSRSASATSASRAGAPVSVPQGAQGGRPPPAAVSLRHRGGQLRRRLRHARSSPRTGPTRSSRLIAVAGHPHQSPLGALRRAGLPPRGRPRHHEHDVRQGQPLRRPPRRRPRRLPRHRRLVRARLPGGRLGAAALRRLPHREVVPRLRRRLPGVRRPAHAGRRRPCRLHGCLPGRRPRGRAQGARLRADRPAQRERRHAHRADLRLALSRTASIGR